MDISQCMAQHTLTILSIVHSSILSLLFAIRLIGSTILSIATSVSVTQIRAQHVFLQSKAHGSSQLPAFPAASCLS